MGNLVACDACDALVRADAKFCQNCGEPLGDAPMKPRVEPVAPARPPEDEDERREAHRSLYRARRTIKNMRRIYVFVAVIFGILAVPAFRADEPIGGSVLLGFAILAGVGAWAIKLQPFAWSTGIAILFTLFVVYQLSHGIARFGSLFMCVFLWSATGWLSGVRTLMKKYPELRATKKILGKHERVRSGAIASSARLKLRAQQWRFRRKILSGAAGVVAMLGIGGFVVAKLSKPPEIEPTLERFVATWNSPGFDGLKDYMHEDYQPRWERILAALHRRNWKQERPKLGDPELTRFGDSRIGTTFAMPAGELHVNWQLEGQSWSVVLLRFPPS